MPNRADEHSKVPAVPADDTRSLPGVPAHLTAHFWHVSPDSIDVHPREDEFQSSLAILADENGNRVAYVRITFMCPDLSKDILANGLAYANRHGGKCIGAAGEQALAKGADEQLLRSVLQRLAGGWYPAAMTMPLADARKQLRKYERAERKRAQERFAYHRVPYIAYASVAEDLRGNGIGTALYRYAAELLGQRGMMLRASTCQTEYAERLWDRIAATMPQLVEMVTVPAVGQTPARRVRALNVVPALTAAS